MNISHENVDHNGYYREAGKELQPPKISVLRRLGATSIKAARNFVRGHFTGSPEGRRAYRGEAIQVHVSDTPEYEYREATVSRRHATRHLGGEAVSAAELIVQHTPTTEGQTPHEDAAHNESAA